MISLLTQNEISDQNVVKIFLKTIHDQMIGLFPDRIAFATSTMTLK